MAEWGLNLEMGFHVVKRVLEMDSPAFQETSKPKVAEILVVHAGLQFALTEDFALVRVNAMVAMWCTHCISVLVTH
ncbi:hypothetical protein PanWU01x14_088820 [Parasponia andersonii]|uniref:Uncharacterized protein n=1 Tax=Parasponia andersonii TaxID=3476 RepID=A0A2P5D828_PARAD|nr:hypothetical protein PanWU01x14_088820 [Parasponia andersonii]